MNKNTRMILAFQIPHTKEAQIRKCCTQEGVEYKRMLPSDHKKTLGSLAGIAGIMAKAASDGKGEKIEQEMLVFSGFDQDALEKFLGLYRKNGIEKVDYKATVTMYNIFWTPEMLYQELKKEHEFMQR